MDFSTIDRSLLSLTRRHPPLPPDVLELSNSLLNLLSANKDSNNNDASSPSVVTTHREYISGIQRLISFGGERWEPLAVGLCLAAHCIEHHVSSLCGYDAQQDGGVYAEGPRIPRVHPPSADDAADDPSLAAEMLSSESELFALLHSLPQTIHANIEHPEPRVRSLVARTVGAYAAISTGLAVRILQGDGRQWDDNVQRSIRELQPKRREVHDAILKSLKFHFELKRPGAEEKSSRDDDRDADLTPDDGTADQPRLSKASDGALDDTTGWRALETNLHALAGYIDGCCVAPVADRDRNRIYPGSYLSEQSHLLAADNWFLSGLQYCSVTHVNRHVRAASSAVLRVIVTACKKCRAYELLLDSPFRTVVKESLNANLADNWSQVRMSGSVLCRTFVEALLMIYREQKEEEDEEEDLTEFELAMGDMVPMLLPRMCLNRFYLAQGVKLYSQDTWKIVFGGQQQQQQQESEGVLEEGGLHSSENTHGGGGMGAVARNAAPLCRYYSKMCDADNHAVREAACQGVAELAQKLGKHPLYAEYLSPHVTMLLQALLMCFHDESWPVRDEACLACGTFCLAYAEECAPELPTLFERWTEQLTDQIWSVREDAAVALGDAITAYGPDMMEKVLALIRKKLPAARDQPQMSREEYKRLQNDASAHTGNQLYSCGSLAPKLRKGGAGRIGCSSCALDRPKAPWEASDGCVYLIREICIRFADNDDTAREDVVIGDAVLMPIMTELADVCRLSHYPQSDDLRTTLWRQLPPIARALGKRRFKGMYLDLFIELLCKNIDDRFNCASQLSVHAAGQCTEELANLIGHGIFRGRLAEVGGAEAFDRVMEERKREHIAQQAAGGFVGAMQFSPFGPVAGVVR
ncbi:hypothetical protein ACHAW6_011669 [Cyclotella cf. meneghiniana]